MTPLIHTDRLWKEGPVRKRYIGLPDGLSHRHAKRVRFSEQIAVVGVFIMLGIVVSIGAYNLFIGLVS